MPRNSSALTIRNPSPDNSNSKEAHGHVHQTRSERAPQIPLRRAARCAACWSGSSDSWKELLGRRKEPLAPAVRDLLGQMTAAGVLMQANIKFNGALIFQVMGDGPLKLAVVEVQPDASFRSTAKTRETVVDDATLQQMLNVHGQGRVAITLDPAGPPAGPAAVPGRRAAERPAGPAAGEAQRRAAALHAAVGAARDHAGARRQRPAWRRAC